MDGKVTLSKNGTIAEVLLDRPSKHNALTPEMYQDISDICRQVNTDDSIHVVIIAGGGERAFCAGSDINGLAAYKDFWAWRNRDDYIDNILSIRKPCIAALKGWVLGGGFEIALACDIRVSARNATFSAPEVTLGWNGAGGAAQHITRLAGYGQAMRLLLTGERIDAEEAFQLRLVEYLTDPGQELEQARVLASRIAEHKSMATQAVKSAVRSAMNGSVSEGMRIENELMALCFAKAEAEKAASSDAKTTS